MRQEAYHSGNLYGFYYEFQGIGEKVPLHNHKVLGNEHNVIVLHGHVVVRGPDFEIKLEPGDVCDFDGMKDHEIVSLSTSAKVLNLYLDGRPADWIEGYVGNF